MSRTLTVEPFYCSQGGIPYNKAHLDAKDAEIARLRADLRVIRDHAVVHMGDYEIRILDMTLEDFINRALEQKP